MGTVAEGAAENGSALLAAVRAGDTALVQLLLHSGTEELGTVDVAFRLAVRAHAGHIAQLLLRYGADPGASPPEELPSLREAVDSGSPALVEALLDDRIRARRSRTELCGMRDLANARHQAGAEAELRRRTGSPDGVVRTRVPDDEFDSVVEFTLGGVSVRDGHGAILTILEQRLGIRAPFEDLLARALRHDPDHSTWGHAATELAVRRDGETWASALALRTHAAPCHRLFGAAVLRLTHLFDGSDEDAFAGPALDVFTDWSTQEEDVAVLTEVLVALGEHADPRADAALLRHAGHPDAGIRRAVASGLGTWREQPALPGDVGETVLALMRDRDAAVRQAACGTLAESRVHDPGFADAMAALLDDTDHEVRCAAVYGLALHDDERCVEASRRLLPPSPVLPPPPDPLRERCLDAVMRYTWRRDGR